jgi:arsenite-transporting ATPase
MVVKKLVKGPERETRFMFFSGKGGVGKTSIATATALWLARRGQKILIISTDPAHSLSDSFDTDIGGEVKKIEKGLFAVEIDPKLSMKEYKEVFTPELEKVSALKGFGLEETFDMAGMTPGIDEVASFDRFLRYMNSSEYDVIVFDTAPTGHTLRFLSLPDVLDSWIGKLIKIRVRLSSITGMVKKLLPIGDSEDEKDHALEGLEGMKKRIEQAKEIMADPKKTQYNMVMIPEVMSIYESERSLSFLNEVGIPLHGVIVNQIIPQNLHCKFCKEKRRLQIERLDGIKKKFPKNNVLELKLFKEEVRGKPMLEKVASELYH